MNNSVPAAIYLSRGHDYGHRMTSEFRLGRDDVIGAISRAVEPLGHVHAMWEGGAASSGRLDEWSDIDLYIVVDDDRVQETFGTVEEALRSLSTIKHRYWVGETSFKGVHQAFYRLEDTSEHLLIDLAVLTLSSPDKLLEPEVHGPTRFHFNKSGRVAVPALDRDAFAERLSARVERIQERFDMFSSFVTKEMKRGNHLEALDAYRVVVLNSLVEALRVRHHPLHHDFGMRYIYHELPQEDVERLEWLSFVPGPEGLGERAESARAWFTEVMDALRTRERLL
jgi:predicted nucleotidyltransferase